MRGNARDNISEIFEMSGKEGSIKLKDLKAHKKMFEKDMKEAEKSNKYDYDDYSFEIKHLNFAINYMEKKGIDMVCEHYEN